MNGNNKWQEWGKTGGKRTEDNCEIIFPCGLQPKLNHVLGVMEREPFYIGDGRKHMYRVNENRLEYKLFDSVTWVGAPMTVNALLKSEINPCRLYPLQYGEVRK